MFNWIMQFLMLASPLVTIGCGLLLQGFVSIADYGTDRYYQNMIIADFFFLFGVWCGTYYYYINKFVKMEQESYTAHWYSNLAEAYALLIHPYVLYKLYLLTGYNAYPVLLVSICITLIIIVLAYITSNPYIKTGIQTVSSLSFSDYKPRTDQLQDKHVKYMDSYEQRAKELRDRRNGDLF